MNRHTFQLWQVEILFLDIIFKIGEITVESAEKFIKRKEEEFKSENKKVKAKDIGRNGVHLFIREAWTFMPQHNLDEKVFLIERLKREKIEGKTAHPSVKIGDIEYRIAYYIIAKNGKTKGKWAWGQFCPFIPQKDFNKLIEKAKKEGTIID